LTISNRSGVAPVTIEVPTSLPGRSSVARIPAWKEPSPRKPSLERHALDRETSVDLHQLDDAGRDRVRPRGLGVEGERDRGLAAPPQHLGGEVGGFLPVAGVAEQFVALGEQRHHRPQQRVFLGQGAGDLLRTQVGQPTFSVADHAVQLPQPVQGRGGHLLFVVLAGPAAI
jgi:hypothetical protein